MKKFILGIIIGAILGSAGAYAASEIVATQASYPVLINGNTYSGNQPVINVNGSTYLPLKATGDALNVPVKWNAEKERVEVGKVPVEPITTNDNVTIEYSNPRAIPEKYFKEILPPYGHDFVAIDVKVTNNSDTAITFNRTDLRINYKIKNGKAYNALLPVDTTVLPEAGITLIRYGDIAPGETRSGVILLDQQKNNIEYRTLSWKGQEIK